MRTNSKHIALEKIRVTLNLLKKSNPGIGFQEKNGTLIGSLKALQDSLRYGSKDVVDPIEVLSPFLSLLRVPYLAGPYKLAALDSIQTFIISDILCESPYRTGTALALVVDAISRCKFVQTDAIGDELVELHIVQTLNFVVKNSVRYYLENETIWNIVDTCYNILLQTGGTSRSSTLYAASEQTLLDTVRFISVRKPEGATFLPPVQEDISARQPCASRILHFFISILQKYRISDAQTKSRGIARKISSRTLLDSASDPDTLELLISLKVLHSMLMSEGGKMTLARTLIIENAELAGLVRDDLGRCLVMLSTKREFSPSVLQSVLSLFGSLFVSLGPSLRVLVECFIKYVYVKALHQLLSLLSKQDEIALGILHLDAVYGQAMGNPGTQHSGVIGFSIDELEMILESLADLISEAGFLPSLFASYDCDPCSPDLVQPLVRYLCQCACHAVTVDSSKVEQLRDINDLTIHCFHQLIRTFPERCSENGGSDELTALRSSGCVSPPPSWAGLNTPPQSSCPQGGRVVEMPKIASDAKLETEPSCESLRGSDIDEISLSLLGLRQSKLLLSEASRLFTTKPEMGLRHLQQINALPTPLTPQSVAKFLRIAQDIPKENVGSYLGELGKDSPKFEGDGKEFHKQVLLHYVLNFELAGQSILNCMRIFLSAFRLPGEAQQIDRILVAFSEYCHSQCIEGKSGLLENPEVAYLLTFSIIMLNTDRHNPNIRADRKMTIDQFVRNNTNYGMDVKQTVPIPRSFLEEIYRSISECPIRTERNDISAELNLEVWMDMQLQASIDPTRGTLVSSSHSPDLVKSLIGSFIVADGGKLARVVDGEKVEEPSVSHDAANVTLRLLTDQLPRDALRLSEVLHGSHWFVDTDLLNCVWRDLLQVGISPFLAHRIVPNPSSQVEQSSPKLSLSSESLQPHKVHGLQIGVDVLVILVKVGLVHNMPSLADLVVFVLAEFSGLLKVGVVEEVISVCNFSFGLSKDARPSSVSNVLEGTKWRPLRSGTHSDDFFEAVMYSVPARVALFALLRLVHCLPMHLGVSSWQLVWVSLGQLRDCALLPKQMVADSDVDLLPAGARQEFEDRIAVHEARTQIASRPLVIEKKSSSLLSLQGLGEAFFGSNPESDAAIDTPVIALTSRWDAGYEDFQRIDVGMIAKPSEGESDETGFVPIVTTHNTHGLPTLASDFTIPDSTYHTLSRDAGSTSLNFSGIENFFEKLRAIIAECDLCRLVADTRFLSENTLLNYYWSLVSVAEAESVSVVAPAVVVSAISRSSSSTLMATAAVAGPHHIDITSMVRKFASMLPHCSLSSCAWLEMVIVDTSLRNRDRFALLWPIVEAHYDRTLRAVESFSHVNERRVTGFFKMATRMISRDQMSNPILELLSRIFTSPANSALYEGGTTGFENSTNVMEQYSGQIAAGLWHLLTLNISILPMLRLEQWQILFDVIAVSARAGGFSSIKAFEVMAWLLHEPRLRAEVPLFCIAALKPLIQNSKAPVSVSIGAIQLLGHLHTRLEVLVKIDDTQYSEDSEDGDGETPVLWESCWTPILRSLADGATDERIPVRLAAVDALSNALLDGHAVAVPPGVLVKILGDIVVPMVLFLGQALVQTASGQRQKNIGNRIEPGRIETTANLEGDSDVGEEATIVVNHADQSSDDAATSSLAPIERSLKCLSSSFLQQLPKLSRYPSFDNLWLRFLHVFGFFLGAPHGFDHSQILGQGSKGRLHNHQVELAATVEMSRDHLSSLIALLAQGGVFRDREGLWDVTRDSVGQMAACSALLDEINLEL